MRKITLFAFAAAVCALASCQKEVVDTQEPAVGKPLTIEVGMPPLTKATYTYAEADGARSLNFEWKVGDKVSIVTYNADGFAITNDIFTATTAGATAKFKGTYTGTATGASKASADIIRVCYPALTLSTEDSYRAEVRNEHISPVYSLSKIKKYGNLHRTYVNQLADNSMDLLEDYDIMFGSLSGTDSPTATLGRVCNVFRIVFDTSCIPAGKVMYRFAIKTETDRIIRVEDWGYNNNDLTDNYWHGGNTQNAMSVYLGPTTDHSAYHCTGIEKTADDNDFVAFVPLVATGADRWKVGVVLNFEMYLKSGEKYTCSCTIKKDLPQMAYGGHFVSANVKLAAAE